VELRIRLELTLAEQPYAIEPVEPLVVSERWSCWAVFVRYVLLCTDLPSCVVEELTSSFCSLLLPV
jgi:hypothetical protein